MQSGKFLNSDCRIPMAALGSYSYKKNNQKRYQYTDAAGMQYFIQITPVNINVATVQFFATVAFVPPHIAPPAGFVFNDKVAGAVAPFMNSFFITWAADYELLHNGNEIWRLTNQKQQSVMKIGVGTNIVKL